MRKHGGKDITLRTRVEKSGREMRRDWGGGGRRKDQGGGRAAVGEGREEGERPLGWVWRTMEFFIFVLLCFPFLVVVWAKTNP